GAHSLRTIDLVHAAYLKLATLNQPDLQDKIRFLSLASLAMRSLLVDYARRRGYAKHGGNPIRVSLADGPAVSEPNIEVLAVDEALTRLSKLDPRKSQIVQLRYFGGLSIEEAAEVLGTSTGTIKREWNKAGAWLRRELRQGQPAGRTRGFKKTMNSCNWVWRARPGNAQASIQTPVEAMRNRASRLNRCWLPTGQDREWAPRRWFRQGGGGSAQGARHRR